MVQAFAHQRPFWWYLPVLPLILLPWTLWLPLWRAAGTEDRSRRQRPALLPRLLRARLPSSRRSAASGALPAAVAAGAAAAGSARADTRRLRSPAWTPLGRARHRAGRPDSACCSRWRRPSSITTAGRTGSARCRCSGALRWLGSGLGHRCCARAGPGCGSRSQPALLGTLLAYAGIARPATTALDGSPVAQAIGRLQAEASRSRIPASTTANSSSRAG